MTTHLAIFSSMTSVPVKVWEPGGRIPKILLHESWSHEKGTEVIQVTQATDKRNETNSRERKSQLHLASNWMGREKKFTDDPKVLSLDIIKVLVSLTQSSTEWVTWIDLHAFYLVYPRVTILYAVLGGCCLLQSFATYAQIMLYIYARVHACMCVSFLVRLNDQQFHDRVCPIHVAGFARADLGEPVGLTTVCFLSTEVQPAWLACLHFFLPVFHLNLKWTWISVSIFYLKTKTIFL